MKNQNLLLIAMVVVEMGNVAEDVAKAKGSVGKLQAMLPLTDELLALGGLDVAELKNEIASFDAAAKEEIKDAIFAKFDLEDDILEEKIESFVNILDDSYEVLSKMFAVFQGFKGQRK